MEGSYKNFSNLLAELAVDERRKAWSSRDQQRMSMDEEAYTAAENAEDSEYLVRHDYFVGGRLRNEGVNIRGDSASQTSGHNSR